ncbi:hypothetical protein [Candidatus Symbiopectobacterium sp.]|uniref:hypothetical protein n=1 Tax=Candidatus Symbiopectobacterium sp. TaxID=2816440 RepID=UPI0025BD4C2D|nr:hypothetical protein [Candidatus Symbiopectobacterium sp.]
MLNPERGDASRSDQRFNPKQACHKALLNKSELVTTAPHTGRLLRDANTVRHS